MPTRSRWSRRKFLHGAALAPLGALAGYPIARASGAAAAHASPLAEFGYGEVLLADGTQESQRRATHAVLMGLADDSLLKPFRAMAGQAAPGLELGGWYQYVPDYDIRSFGPGFAPAATFGQWVSALARNYAITGEQATRAKLLRLNRLYAQTISADFYDKNRFPAYCYDKLVCGLIDSHRLAGDSQALAILERTTDTALPHLPGHAVEHGRSWRAGKDYSYTWDESYTNPENLFLAYQYGAGRRYRAMAVQYLDAQYFGPLAQGRNVLAGRHAYSHVNALSSAMQAYLTVGSRAHLRAAANGFEMLRAQSYATGGWGPDETLRAAGSDDLAASLENSHHSFETPCGAYAHFKLTRYLLRVTRDARYGDSMERVMYNTVLGVKPMLADGSTFYYSDYNFRGRKVYSEHRWPCCSGTLPQVAADYRINAYFKDRRALFVNLYLPSTVNWQCDGARVSLTQRGAYPAGDTVQFDVTSSQPADFALLLRIPAWAEGAAIAVNGVRVPGAARPGAFALLQRRWQSGDRVELELPQRLRLEPIDPRHAHTVALLRGPQVLFAITGAAPVVTRQQLLAAARTGEQAWRAQTATASLDLLPFTEIAEQPYSTYLTLSG